MLSKNQVKNIQSLHVKKSRHLQQAFIAEGKKIVSEIINSSWIIKNIYATTEWIEENRSILRNKQLPVTEVDDSDLEKISTQTNPQQVLAVCEIPSVKLNTSLIVNNLSLYLDAVRDPGNLGTIIRAAEWFGIQQVLCSPDTAELFNPKTIQSTMGSFLRVKIVYISLQEIMEELNTQKVTIYGAGIDGEDVFKLKKFHSGLLVIGNEANGISEQTKQQITQMITIPASPASQAESLNAAMAATIIMAEFYKHNHKKGS